MPAPRKVRAQPWLQRSLRTPIGEIELAGMIVNGPGIDPAAMRVLRRFTLVLMVSGQGYFRDGRGASFDVEAGDAILVFPEIAHAYGPRNGGEWTQVYFVFDGPEFQLWRAQGLLNPDRPVLRVGRPDHWQRRLHDLVEDEPAHRAGGPLRAMGRFLQVLAEMIATDAENEHRGGRDAWLERSLRMLGERGEGGWASPQAVALEVGLSYENFRKRFVQLMGESPGRYQKRRRIEWACAAIYHGDSSFKEIADLLGFCDVFHFSKAFKQVTGFTPSEYRQRVRGR